MSKANDDVLIRVHDLKTHFFLDEGVAKAVDGVSFDIRRGKTLGLVGESGCGKSVSALSILRLVPAPPGRIVGGTIEYDGRNLLELSESEMRAIRGNDIAMIFQEPMTSLNPVLTIGEQIAGTLVIGLSFDRIDRHIREEVNENNRRAFSISVVGSVLLAALGGYLLKLHDKARLLQSALERDRHLAYIGTISAGLAHESRNPLSSVKMNVQMIRNRLEKLPIEDKESLIRKIDRVGGEADRLEESVNDFLIFAAPRPLKKQLTDINAAIDSVVEFLRVAQQDINVTKQYDPALPQIEVDQDMFIQILRNLVINAQQAAGTGGKVEIATILEDNAVHIAVSDDGPGVPADKREKIFEVFHTTKKSGTGLGLNIARRIAEDHGGAISLEESSLGGARFVVRLPLAARNRADKPYEQG